MQVCRLFRNIDDVSLQYKNELEIAGMLDGPTSELETIDRLKILREHQSAWESLSWTAEETIRQMGGVWELNGGVLGQALSHSSLMFWQLPSRIRGVQSRNWIIQVPDTNIRDFTMDPSYDLLIAVQLAEYVLVPNSLVWVHNCYLGHAKSTFSLWRRGTHTH